MKPDSRTLLSDCTRPDRQRRFRSMLLLFMMPILLLLSGPAVTAAGAGTAGQAAAPSSALDTTPPVKKLAIGTFEGLADSHTVEVSVYSEPVDLQFEEALAARTGKLEEGDRVILIYSEQRVEGDEVVRIRNLLYIKKMDDQNVY